MNDLFDFPHFLSVYEDKNLVIALCLLPPETVADAFCFLCEEMLITLLDEYENLEVFADYVLTNYITDEETGRIMKNYTNF